ncbi:hypothetical protein DACRYDRAFT_25243, partial [Dacryopinax primogenitus]
MPWRERLALRRERQAELGVRAGFVAPAPAGTSGRPAGPRSASVSGYAELRRADRPGTETGTRPGTAGAVGTAGTAAGGRPGHSRQVSGASEYFSVRGRSPDLREEDLRPDEREHEPYGDEHEHDPRDEHDAEHELDAEYEQDEVEAYADAEDSREVDRERTMRTADWLGAGPGRRALRAAGLLEENDKERREEKESCPPTAGSRTAKRGRYTPSSLSFGSQDTATRRRSVRSASAASAASAASGTTPSLVVDSHSLTPTTASASAATPSPSPSAYGIMEAPGLAQVLELHNLEKGALLGALRESKAREREREEEVRRLEAELGALRRRIDELELVVAKQVQQQQRKKTRLPMPKQRVASAAASFGDRPPRPAVKRSGSVTTLNAPLVPISPPSSGRSHSTGS